MNAGATISYAGVLEVVYFDCETGKVYALNAGFNTVLAEDDPTLHPDRVVHESGAETNSGAAGGPSWCPASWPVCRRFTIGSASCRSRDSVPAIYFAEHGIPITPRLGRWMEYRKDILSRLAETKAVFTNNDGEFYAAGDTLAANRRCRNIEAVARRRSATTCTVARGPRSSSAPCGPTVERWQWRTSPTTRPAGRSHCTSLTVAMTSTAFRRPSGWPAA